MNEIVINNRKNYPLIEGLLDYFPDAINNVASLLNDDSSIFDLFIRFKCAFFEISNVSLVGNRQHSPGQRLHLAKDKSTDDADALMRHLLEDEEFDNDGCRHYAKVAWRALRMLQVHIDESKKDGYKIPDEKNVENLDSLSLKDEIIQRLILRNYLSDSGFLQKTHIAFCALTLLECGLMSRMVKKNDKSKN